MLSRHPTITKTSSSSLRLPALRGASPGIAPYAYAGVALVASLAVAAFVNHRNAKRAERDNPAHGKFVVVDGVRLHYVERGQGATLVLLHGNGSMIQGFRVVRLDRQGCGAVPRDRVRPSRLRPQRPSSQHGVDPGSAGRPT